MLFNPGLSFFTWVTFLILAGLLWKFGWDPILEALENREEKIHDDLSSAEEQREKAEQLLNERKEELSEAQAETREMINDARAKAEQVGEEIEQEARSKAESMVESAEKEIEAERRNALDSVESQVGNLAIDLAEEILHKEIDEEDHQQKVDEFLSKLDSQTVNDS